MTPENPSFVVSETLGQNATLPTPEDIAEIHKLQTEGKSLGTSVSLHMINEANNWFSDLSQRLSQEPKLSKTQVAQRLIALAHYRMIPSAFLDAEEVIRFNKPQIIPNLDPEQTDLGGIVTDLALDFITMPEANPASTAAEANLYLKKFKLGIILKQTNSPLEVIRQASANIRGLIQAGIQKSLREKDEEKKEVIQQSLRIALESTIQSQIRFGLLYDSSQQPPNALDTKI